MKDFNTNTTNNDEWLTPPEILQALGPFDLDPCSPVNRPWDTAENHYTIEDNGFLLPWHGRVWLNPPYGRDMYDWLNRLSSWQNGIALIFARTETKGFHTLVWQKAHSVFFFAGRIRFYTVEGSQSQNANAPSCLVSYSQADTDKIQTAIDSKQLTGKLVIL